MIKLKKKLFLIIALICLYSTHILAKDKYLEVSQMDESPVSLTPYFAIYEDTTGLLTLSDIQKPEFAERFKQSEKSGEALNFAYTQSAIWLCLHLTNNSDKPVERMLEIAYPLLATIDFYQPFEGNKFQTIQTGYSLPFVTRPHENRFFVIPILLPRMADQIIYIKIQTPNSMNIPESIRAKIFDPFFTTKRAGEGSGLGLGIVKGIIEKHKGRIEVKSEVGVGTEFLVFIPIKEVISIHKK